MNKVSPSVMCINTMELKEKITALDNAHVDLYHIDIMDGHFVPNFCLNGYIMKDIAAVSKTPMDVHLMVTNPKEAVKAGIAINPSTNIDRLAYMLDDIDLICIMTVEPGFAGQTLIPATIDKITAVRKMFSDAGKDVEIMVDGQVKETTAPKLVAAGANVLVVGTSGLFNVYTPEEYPRAIQFYQNIA